MVDACRAGGAIPPSDMRTSRVPLDRGEAHWTKVRIRGTSGSCRVFASAIAGERTKRPLLRATSGQPPHESYKHSLVGPPPFPCTATLSTTTERWPADYSDIPGCFAAGDGSLSGR